jgi:hypothetical protein
MEQPAPRQRIHLHGQPALSEDASILEEDGAELQQRYKVAINY